MSVDFNLDLKAFSLAFCKVVNELKTKRKKMLITMHRFLDGDAFGSAVAFGLILRKFNIDSTLLCIPLVPAKLKFLANMNELHIVEPFRIVEKDVKGFYTETVNDYFSEIIEDYGAMTILDCAGLGQIPQEAWSIGSELPYKINIDHHFGYKLNGPANRVFNLVGNFSSTSEILFRFIQEIGMDLFPEIAVAIYIGILSDLSKNEILKNSSCYPQNVINALDSHVKKMGPDTHKDVQAIFSLDAWEKYLLKNTLAEMRFAENVVHVKFDRDMVFKAKQAKDALDDIRLPFHEFHVRLRHRLKRFKKDFPIAVIFDQIFGKVSLYDLQQRNRYDLPRLSSELGAGGGHSNRAGFSFKAAREKIMCSGNIPSDVSDDIIRKRIIAIIERRLSGMTETPPR